MELSKDDQKKLENRSPLTKTLASMLVAGINQLVNGECDDSDSNIQKIIDYTSNLICPEKPMSKYKASEYLGVCSRQFDRYVEQGKIPKGKPSAGFKELSWLKKDLDKFKKSINKDNQLVDL